MRLKLGKKFAIEAEKMTKFEKFENFENFGFFAKFHQNFSKIWKKTAILNKNFPSGPQVEGALWERLRLELFNEFLVVCSIFHYPFIVHSVALSF